MVIIKSRQEGQILLEVTISIALGAVFIIAGAFAISNLLASNATNRKLQTAIDLGNGLMDNVKAVTDANWNNIYLLTKASSTHYYINTATSPFSTSSGDQVVSVGGLAYTRYFYIDNVSRDLCGTGQATTTATTTCTSGPGSAGVSSDPSTQKITVVVTWPGAAQGVTFSQYLTRVRNGVFVQTDWSGGAGQELFATTTDGILVNNKFASSSNVTFSSLGSISLTTTSGELTSSVFDTLVLRGVAINSVMWEGSQPVGAVVKFRIGSSNSPAGPWSYLGPDGTGTTWYVASGPDQPVKLTRANHTNKRYMRYRAEFNAPSVPFSPVVSDIILNWSQ